MLDGGRVTSKEADISHQEKVTQIWQTDREPHTQTKSKTIRNTNSHKKQKYINSSFQTCCISFIYASKICMFYIYAIVVVLGTPADLSDIFKTLTAKLTSGFRPSPHFLENKIFAENIWPQIFYPAVLSHICAHT